MSETNGKMDSRKEKETPKLPPEMQKALDRFLEENRGVFEALARL